MKKAWVISYPLSAQWRLWSDWADAQTDPSLRWAHTHFVGFVMSWLVLGIGMISPFSISALHVGMSSMWSFHNLGDVWSQCSRICYYCFLFGFDVAVNNFSVTSRRCLVATESSTFTFIVLPHWSIMPRTLDRLPHPVTLSWHLIHQS